MGPMHRFTHIFIGGSCDSASIQDHQIRDRCFAGRSVSLGEQGRFDGGAIRLRSAAAEVLYVETLHWSDSTNR